MQALPKKRGGGKSLPVTITAKSSTDTTGTSVVLEPKDPDEPWTKTDKACITQLYNALGLSGFPRAAKAATAGLHVIVDLPHASQAKGFSFVAMMGGFRHSVSLEARQGDKTAWTIEASANHELDDRPQVFPSLALAMVGKFGSPVTGEETVNVDEYDARFDAINAGTTPTLSSARP